MYRKAILVVLVSAALAGFVAPTTADHNPGDVTYIAGTHTAPLGVEAGLVLCEGPDGALPDHVGAGGACRIHCEGSGDSCRITVTDDQHGPWGFSWRCEGRGATTEAHGSATIPNSCTAGTTGDKHVTVFVHAGATTGTITAGKV